MNCSTPVSSLFHYLSEFPQIHVHFWCYLSIILYDSFVLFPSIFPAIQVFSSELTLGIRWPKYWSLSFNICPSNEYSGLISFRFDLLAVQGILKSLLQHQSSKASILQCSAFFMVQLSHPYMTTGKIIALTIWTFVGKIMSLLFNTLSRFVIGFLPRSMCLLISWLQSQSAAMNFGAQGNKVCHCFHFPPSICQEVMRQDAWS